MYKRTIKLILLFILFLGSCKLINPGPKDEYSVTYHFPYTEFVAKVDTTINCLQIDTLKGYAVARLYVTKTGRIKKITLFYVVLWNKYDTIPYNLTDTNYKYSEEEIKLIYRKIYPAVKRYIRRHIKFYVYNHPNNGLIATKAIDIGCD